MWPKITESFYFFLSWLILPTYMLRILTIWLCVSSSFQTDNFIFGNSALVTFSCDAPVVSDGVIYNMCYCKCDANMHRPLHIHKQVLLFPKICWTSWDWPRNKQSFEATAASEFLCDTVSLFYQRMVSWSVQSPPDYSEPWHLSNLGLWPWQSQTVCYLSTLSPSRLSVTAKPVRG